MRKTITGVAVAAMLAALGVQAHASTAAPAWKVTQTTKLPGDDVINDVTVSPTGSAWAVGGQDLNSKVHPVVQHYVSGKWQNVKLPSTWKMHLLSVTASSSKNVWAFGDGGKGGHWNGKKWTAVNPGSFNPGGATAISSSNVWLTAHSATARHWNGKKWSKVKLPAPARTIHAISAKNIYAAGTSGTKGVIMHYDGKKWKTVKTVTPPSTGGENPTSGFSSIAVSGKSVWVVGGAEWGCGEDADNQCYQPLALKLTGKTWTSYKGSSKYYGQYESVTADGSGGVWLLQGKWNPTFAHQVGSTVTYAQAPAPAGHDINLNALANKPGTKTVWSAGFSSPQGDPDDPTADGVYLSIG